VTEAEDFAWACGLFEGEGNIRNHMDANSRRNVRRLTVGTTDLDVLERFASVVGCGKIRGGRERTNNGKLMWRWECSHWDDTEPLLRRMLPHLGVRRRAAAEALLANPPSRRSPRRALEDVL
jgi:hypothetical protein